jgi:predicted metalloprotease
MRTDDFRPSDNVEDDRAGSASRGGLPGGAGGLGIGTVIVIALISWYFGIDPSALLNGAQILTGSSSTEQTGPAPPVVAGTPTDPTGKFVALVLGDTEDRWKEIFSADGRVYLPARLRLFQHFEKTPCAAALPAMGPFYCPRDQHIYLDLSFFDDLEHKFGGCSNSNACKFSEAYVIAHEVGHHVQDEYGLLPRVMAMQQASNSSVERNRLQVRVELQADCYAGVWANRAQKKHNFLEAGDVDAALQTASAIGDDRLQKQAQGYVVPDAFTHGTSEQRKRWFLAGFNTGKREACDTMSAKPL